MSRLHYKHHQGIIQLGRNLRKTQTPQEILVWSILRKRKISGYKFLRQHPVFYREEYNWVDFYIPDFYCNKLKLIIEVDGKIHNNQAEYDKERDQKLGEKGIHVVRIVNEMTEDLIKLESYLTNLISERSTYISQH